MSPDVAEPRTFGITVLNAEGEVVTQRRGTIIPMTLRARQARVVANSPPPRSSVPCVRPHDRAPRSRSRRASRNHSPPRRTSGDDDADPPDGLAQVSRLRLAAERALDTGDFDLAVDLYARAEVTRFCVLWRQA
jgi:hypothetical protein